MFKRASNLLDSPEAWLLPNELHSCWNARGMYSPLQFVLRLRPDIHRALNQTSAGWHSASLLSFEQRHAASTYLHETIHWWQHVGSSSGLFLSLLYPAQAHLNHRHLQNLLRAAGPFKSIYDRNIRGGVLENEGQSINDDINIILNNWHDIEFYRYFITDPTHASEFVNDKYFESQCHSFKVAIRAVLWLISSVADPEVNFIPDTRTWEDVSNKLSTEKVEGFYYGSPVRIPPVGARQIFEGQARVSQLQFLFAGISTASFAELVEGGYLEGVYGEAFACYLELTDCDPPETIHDAIVATFLLICDIAINPSEGVVKEFQPFHTLLEQHDPGLRFVRLCGALNKCLADVLAYVGDYSANGYRRASEILCGLANVSPPLFLAQTAQGWSREMPGLKKLLEEDSTFNFENANLPVRVFVARFFKFQLDKLEHPEVFCWPGYWMAGSHVTEEKAAEVLRLFNEHSALFLDKEDGDVYPRLWASKDESTMQHTFDRFYTWVAVYDLVRQWTVTSGPFAIDFGWLSSKFSQTEMEGWANEAFKHVFGVSPEEFKILNSS